ncbi:hypothetical protein [Tuberibacillus sp. Marseille-P3662]|uniref:hypothetical protein n=1 Tax=Tuberibacillus sp. Marseille-P3662 TaxID=1965358 RepID=UPI000A1CE223|nr:hypothetical protein [Tuberibacillus sp. Marseille-P3662]
MLTFEDKLAIIESFPELKRKDVSLGRVNFHFEESVMDKKIVVYRLHPNGNGYVYAELIDDHDNYNIEQNGMVNIRDFSEDELRSIVRKSIDSLSQPSDETWVNDDNHTLRLVYDFGLWNTYAGDMLDGTFPTYNEALDYLHQEGFERQ